MQIGAGIQITPNASKHLLRWGVGEYLPDLCRNMPCFKIRRWENGEIIGRLKTEEHIQCFGGPYVQTHRADLQQALVKVAIENDVKVHTNSRIIDYDFNIPAIILHDGRKIEMDLIFAADGRLP